MRYIIGFLFLFLCFSVYGQTVRTVGLVYVASAPTHTPSSQGAWLAVDTTSGSWYEWERTTGVWRDAGYRVQFTYTSGAPNYTPAKARGRMAVNSGDSLYVYQNATWNLLSGGGGGADNWGTDVVNRDGTLSGDGTPSAPLKVDTSIIATIYDITTLSSTDTSGYNLTFTRSADTIYLRDGDGTLFVVLPAATVDTDDQGLTIGGSGPTYSIDIDGGSDVTISAGGIITLSESTPNVLTFTANETDGSVTNEIQNVDTLVLSGTTLGISLSSDGVAQKTVNLSSLQDGTGTDDQLIDTFQIVSNVLRLSVESDAEPFKSVDLSPYLDNTDTQDLTIDSAGDWYTITLENGGSVNVSKADISGGDNWGSQVVEADFGLSGNGTTGNELQVDSALVATLYALKDSASDIRGDFPINTDDQKIDTFEIVSNVLRVSNESDGEPFKSVDLTPYLDNTDTQDLSIDSAGDWYTVTLVNGGSVNVKKDTDTQLTEEQVEDYVGGMVTGNTETLITVDYQDGDGTLDFVVEDDLALYDNTTSGFISAEVDGSVTNEIQAVDTLLLSGTTLGISLSSDGVAQKTVDLASLQDGVGTDDQKIDTFEIVSNVLRLSAESDAEPFKSVDLSPYLDDTDTDDQGLTVTGSGPDYVINQEDGTDITVSAAGITTLSEPSANELRITATEVDGSTSNELQTYGHAGTTTYTNTLSDGGGSFSITGAGINVVSQTAGAVTVTGIEVDGSTTNELQDLTVTGSGPTYALDMSNGADVTVEGAGIVTLSEGTANVLTVTATEVDGSTSNEIQDITLSGTTTVTFDLSGDATDATITGAGISAISRSGNDITVTSTEVDGSTSNEIQTISVTDDGTTFDFDLSGTASDFALVEGTGITLSRTGNDVTIESTGGADDQGLTITGSGPDYVVDIDGGSDVTISAAGISTLSEGTANVLTITSTEVDGSITNEIQSISVTGTTTATIDLSDDATDASITGAGIAAVSVVGNAITVTATEAQSFSGSDDGTTFTLDLSGASTDISFKEGTNVTITRTGTELTFASSGSADNWGTDVVNRDGTLSGNGTVGTPLKVDTTIIATKDHVFKGKVSQESSETIKTSDFTAVKFTIHPVDCSAGVIEVTPPSSPAIGDRFAIVDAEATAGTNNITVDFTTGSYKLYSAIQDYIINVDGGYVEFIYMGTTTGWIATKG